MLFFFYMIYMWIQMLFAAIELEVTLLFIYAGLSSQHPPSGCSEVLGIDTNKHK